MERKEKKNNVQKKNLRGKHILSQSGKKNNGGTKLSPMKKNNNNTKYILTDRLKSMVQQNNAEELLIKLKDKEFRTLFDKGSLEEKFRLELLAYNYNDWTPDVSVNCKTPFVDSKDHWNTVTKKVITMVKDRYKKKKKKLVDQMKKQICQRVLMTK